MNRKTAREINREQDISTLKLAAIIIASVVFGPFMALLFVSLFVN